MKVKILHERVEALAKNYHEQFKLYQDMLKFAQEQSEIINKGQIEEMMHLIGKRQNLIEEIQRINSDGLLLKEEVMDILHLKEFSTTKILELVNIQGSRELNKIVVELGKLLTEINNIDLENQKGLVERLQDVKRELKNIHHGQQARQAYKTYDKVDPLFIDKKK